MNFLFIIPARGGSKGLPGKNILPLNGKPLLHYSIEYARLFTDDKNICLTTDSEEIIACAMQVGLSVPFIRPADLSGDFAGTYEVLQHAANHYRSLNIFYDGIILLQPTSPLREEKYLRAMLKLYHSNVDMVVSVMESKGNPYFNLFEESDGLLQLSKPSGYKRRQDSPAVYQFNGSIYIINMLSLFKYDSISAFKKKVKYVMPAEHSIDIDTKLDFEICELIIKRHRL